MKHDDVEQGVGVLTVSESMLSEFMSNKPDDLEVIGSVWCLDATSPCVSLILRGAAIPTVVSKSGIPVIDCLVTELEDGSFEWDFFRHESLLCVKPWEGPRS